MPKPNQKNFKIIGVSKQNSKFTQYGCHFFSSIIVSTHLQNNLQAFKIKSSDILFHSSSIAVLNQPIFGWDVAFSLFSKTPHIA